MPRKFKGVDYEATLDQSVSIRECLPPGHLARFIATVITELDLSEIYAAYGCRGGTAIAPEVLLGLLFYGYASGVFSSHNHRTSQRTRAMTTKPRRSLAPTCSEVGECVTKIVQRLDMTLLQGDRSQKLFMQESRQQVQYLRFAYQTPNKIMDSIVNA